MRTHAYEKKENQGILDQIEIASLLKQDTSADSII